MSLGDSRNKSLMQKEILTASASISMERPLESFGTPCGFVGIARFVWCALNKKSSFLSSKGVRLSLAPLYLHFSISFARTSFRFRMYLYICVCNFLQHGNFIAKSSSKLNLFARTISEIQVKSTDDEQIEDGQKQKVP